MPDDAHKVFAGATESDVHPPDSPSSGTRRPSSSTRRPSDGDGHSLEDAGEGTTQQPKLTRFEDFKARCIDVARYAPLLTALAAPISTLLSIPGLTEPWFFLNGLPAPDVTTSIALSAVTLATNVVANVLLVARFTVRQSRYRHVTMISIGCWWLTLLFALVNLAVYGAFARNKPGYTYDEGFWAAVASVCIVGFITFLLSLHWVLRFDRASTEGEMIRVAGFEFIAVVSTFVGLLAIEGLVFSKIEGWSFLQGIYFSLVTAFTIGLGDYEPTKAVSRVLLFPFALLSIALLAVQVSVLVDFLSIGTENRRSRWRQRYEEKFMTATEKGDGTERRALVEELKDLQDVEDREELWEGAFNLLMSTASLVAFWLVGGAAFMAIEGWAFGTSMYFTYIFFLTIGYGDYSPVTPGGRVFFIVFAILAVPIVTNFVLNTVSSLLTTAAARRFQRAKDRRAPENSEQRKFHSHAHNVQKSTSMLEERLKDAEERQEALTKAVLGLAIRLEAQATTLLIGALDHSSKPQLLLRADRNLQRRALRNLSSEKTQDLDLFDRSMLALEEEMREEVENAEDVAKFYLDPTTGQTDQLEQVRRYRETVGGLLAAGTMLLGLEGEQKLRLERRIDGEHEDDHGGMLLGSGREGPAEKELGVDV